jgi:hypothetical protein
MILAACVQYMSSRFLLSILRCFWWKRKMTCGGKLDEEEGTTHP